MKLLGILVMAILALSCIGQPATAGEQPTEADVQFGLGAAKGWYFQVDPPIDSCVNPVTGRPGLELALARPGLSAIKFSDKIAQAEACVSYPFCEMFDWDCILDGDYYLHFRLEADTDGDPWTCVTYNLAGLRRAVQIVGVSFSPGGPYSWAEPTYTDPGTGAFEELCLWEGMEVRVLLMACPDNTSMDGREHLVWLDDLFNVAFAIGMTEDSPGWNELYDPGEDGVVSLFSSLWGKHGVLSKAGVDCDLFQLPK